MARKYSLFIIVYTCMLVMCIPLTVDSMLSENETLDNENDTKIINETTPDSSNLTSLDNSTSISNLYNPPEIICILWKEVNDTVFTVHKSRAEVGEGEFTDYTEMCYRVIVKKLLEETIFSLAGK